MIILGLTGSIGMGKSTVASMFRDAGVPVFDSDASVHALYAGAAVPVIEQAFPGVAIGGTIDRARLASRVIGDDAAMKRLETLVHPLVKAAREAFLVEARARGAPIAVLDIPLLFETGSEDEVDAVAVVSATESVQKSRVMTRPGMTEERFSAILRKQMPDAEKRRRATHIIDTGRSLDETRQAVSAILASLAAGQPREP